METGKEEEKNRGQLVSIILHHSLHFLFLIVVAAVAAVVADKFYI